MMIMLMIMMLVMMINFVFQAARVEREVAKLQRTINETQRRWEESYARHSRPGGCVLSDDSPDFVRNPRTGDNNTHLLLLFEKI